MAVPWSNDGLVVTGDRVPRHGGLVAAMVLPAFALALLACIALVRDWRAAQREAIAHAQELAGEVGTRLAVFLDGVSVASEVRLADWRRGGVGFHVGLSNQLLYPLPAVWPPVPESPEAPPSGPEGESWKAGFGAVEAGDTAEVERQFDVFLATTAGDEAVGRWEGHRKRVQFERALMAERQGRAGEAAEWFDQVMVPGARGGWLEATTAAGLPMAQLAAWRILDMAGGRFESLPKRWQVDIAGVADSLAGSSPTPFLPWIFEELERMSGLRPESPGGAGAGSLLAKYQGAERARLRYAQATRRFPGTMPWPDAFWLEAPSAGPAELVVRSTGPGGRSTMGDPVRSYGSLSEALLLEELRASWRALDRRGDFFARTTVEGRELVGGPVDVVVPSSRRELAGTVLRTTAGVGIAVSLGLLRPEAYYSGQRRRVGVFGGLILVAAGASVVAAWATRRSMQRQFELNRAKSNFVSSVSHELRAPLGSIRLLAEGLERGTVPDGARRTEYFRLIGQETRRLGALVENVLDFSRIEQGRRRYEPEPVDLAALVRGTIRLFEPLAFAREVRLAVELPVGDDPVEGVVDGRAIQQALLNLLDNALKHSPAGASIRVGLRRPPGDGAIRLSVADDGPGIPATEHGRIFEPFYRRGSELRRETQGVGIGLSIVRHVVLGHGGEIELESAPGRGATFTLVLPGASGGPASIPPAGVSPASGTGLRI